MSDTLFRLGRREIDAAARTVRLDGRLRPIEPRPFDLLVHLISHRRRVVTKEELLEALWPQEVVSISSLARAVMKARQAIADDDSPALIRSVPRIGYRFAGEVRVEAPLAPEPPRPSTDESIVIALLPMAHAGDAPFDRSTRTPLSLVGYAMATDMRLVPLSMYAVEAALKDVPGNAGPEAQIAALHLREKVQHVVQVRIGMTSAGCRLGHCLLTVPGQTPGTLLAHDPVEAGDLLARHIMAILRPGDPSRGGFALRDAWTLQLFARAMQASEQGQWKRAAHVLRVVLDCMPRHPGTQQALARAETMLRGAPPANLR